LAKDFLEIILKKNFYKKEQAGGVKISPLSSSSRKWGSLAQRPDRVLRETGRAQ
jgi:hypothetical protein